MLNDIKNEINDNNIQFNKSSIGKRIFKNHDTNTYNILNNKERDIKKFNDFAISKLMDINDIKKDNKCNYFDYYYNRNNNILLNNNFEMKIKNNKKIPGLIEYYGKNKYINDLLMNLK